MKNLFSINTKIMALKYKVVYGAGKEGQLLYDRLQEKNVTVDYFADSNCQLCGKVIKGIEVISFEQLKEINDQTAVLLSKGYQEQIYKFLVENGIKNIFLSHVENGIILAD